MGTRFSILETQIGSQKHLKKPWSDPSISESISSDVVDEAQWLNYICINAKQTPAPYAAVVQWYINNILLPQSLITIVSTCHKNLTTQQRKFRITARFGACSTKYLSAYMVFCYGLTQIFVSAHPTRKSCHLLLQLQKYLGYFCSKQGIKLFWNVMHL